MAEPMYRRIAEDLRSRIESGEMARGTQLPTEIELREKYNASRNTVRDAIKSLITRGLVETRPGQGTFVIEKIVPFVTTLTGDPRSASGGEGSAYVETAAGPGGEADPGYDREVTASRRRPKASPPKVEIQQASPVLSGELQTGDEMVVIRHQERYIDETPWSLQTSFYPMSLVERGALRLIQAQNIGEGTVAYLNEALGIKQAGYRDLITVRAPDNTEATFFKLPDDGQIFVIETRRIAFDEEGAPFRLTVSVYPADRNWFAVNVGQVPDG